MQQANRAGNVIRGRYHLDDIIGSGAFGAVYRAADRQNEDFVAIKVIKIDLLRKSRNTFERFMREAEALRALQHPNIVGFIEAFIELESAYLVMEYVAGGTLKSLLNHVGGLEIEAFRHIALGMVEGVAAAHRLGIIHRDLKPANVLLGRDNTPKICDFGLVKISEATTVTITGSRLGTIAYMPPEAFDARRRPDHRTDIWALGVMLFEMLTGRRPFLGGDEASVIGSILNQPPLDLRSHRDDVPEVWEHIINHCLEKDPDWRYQSLDQLAEDLRYDRYTGRTTRPRRLPPPDWLSDTDPALEFSDLSSGDFFLESKPTPATEVTIADDILKKRSAFDSWDDVPLPDTRRRPLPTKPSLPDPDESVEVARPPRLIKPPSQVTPATEMESPTERRKPLPTGELPRSVIPTDVRRKPYPTNPPVAAKPAPKKPEAPAAVTEKRTHELMFVRPEATNETHPTRPKPPTLETVRFPLGISIIGQMILWIGVALTLVSGALFATHYVPGAQFLAAEFKSSLSTLTALQILGALAFTAGIFTEFLFAKDIVQGSFTAGLAVITFAVWFIFFSEFFFEITFDRAALGSAAFSGLVFAYLFFRGYE